MSEKIKPIKIKFSNDEHLSETDKLWFDLMFQGRMCIQVDKDGKTKRINPDNFINSNKDKLQ